ncbi:MAG: carbohydrate kinase family protein [Patescibacteria group bacterium]
MTSFDVITFGSGLVDIFLSSSEFKLLSDSGGVSLCGSYGSKLEVDQRVISSGGGGTNTAVSFSRLGLKSAVVCRLGNDLLADLVIQQLVEEGVSIEMVFQADEETDSSVVLLGPDGGRTVLVYRGQTRLGIDNINLEKLSASWFYLASLEGNLDLVERLFAFGKEKKIRLAWNPGKKELVDANRVKGLVSGIDVLLLNRQEAEELLGAGLETSSFWSELGSLGANYSVVTDGRQGAYLYFDGEKHFLPAPAVNSVDETGAGDAFGSGFVAGLIKGMDWKQSLDLAMANGAAVVIKIGAKTGLINHA